ncbi:hypothetical protein H257_14968 [Aphanomyces astaci]|uniref:Zinc finger CHCC-type domain-containing protein n=2 Tax=Aphanomyces astaci TaxID=112090 RepID=W4FPE3_APHAT|nr:hypothetical protein H257_14968 [Aphanomyces astaci]ETV69362.1 hypothetical protein H257_14968 [Aphanomyces astaci]RHY84993.1 hypothetical protein DYB35_007203 [Aphanomyces astaci]|eukprot:XP_009841219.1 hypothetical protein H257_14968 [Aphanomyces astaci]
MRGHQVFRALRAAAPVRFAGVKTSVPRAFAAAQQVAGYATIYDLKTPFEDTNRHRSDAELRIAQVPVVEVDSDVAVCDGGGGALGHPVEYIALNIVSDKPQTCKYCGLRYKQKHHHH